VENRAVLSFPAGLGSALESGIPRIPNLREVPCGLQRAAAQVSHAECENRWPKASIPAPDTLTRTHIHIHAVLRSEVQLELRREKARAEKAIARVLSQHLRNSSADEKLARTAPRYFIMIPSAPSLDSVSVYRAFGASFTPLLSESRCAPCDFLSRIGPTPGPRTMLYTYLYTYTYTRSHARLMHSRSRSRGYTHTPTRRSPVLHTPRVHCARYIERAFHYARYHYARPARR